MEVSGSASLSLLDGMDVKHTGRLPIWSLALLVIMVLILGPHASISAAMTTDQSARLESNCTCIGYPLNVQCITIGPGATIWQGSALNCPSYLNKIQLYHSRFASGTATGSCNNGNIVARSLDTVEGRYRSQLNIGILTPEMNGTIIECLYDNGIHTQSINNITIIAKTVPNISMSTIDVTPTYANNTNNLTKLTTRFNTIENMWSTDSINSSVLSYTINYTDSNTGTSCGNSTIPATSCISGMCSSVFYVKSSTCPPEANFTVKVYGINALGDGKTSDPLRQDFTNHLLKVVAYPLRRIISCEFYYKSNSIKSCSATFFDEYCQSIIFTTNGSTTGSYINLHYDLTQHKRCCYVIAAKNGTMKVNISGILIYQTDTNHNRNYNVNEDGWIAAVATLFPVIFVTTVTLFVIIAIGCMHRPRRYNPSKKRN